MRWKSLEREREINDNQGLRLLEKVIKRMHLLIDPRAAPELSWLPGMSVPLTIPTLVAVSSTQS